MPRHTHNAPPEAEQDAGRLKMDPRIDPCMRPPCRAPLACSAFGYCRIRNQMIDAACAAEEQFGVDECERFADEARREQVLRSQTVK